MAERVTPELQHEVEQLYYREAELLDERRIEEWTALLAPEFRYRVPVRATRTWREIAPPEGATGSSVDRELVPGGAWLDETRADVLERLRKLRSGSAWAEDPPSRTRRLVTNVRIAPSEAGILDVRSAFLLYRNRSDTQVDLFAGERRDRLLRGGPHGFSLVDRVVVLDQSVLLAGHLGVFL